jgi:hypothetical protein
MEELFKSQISYDLILFFIFFLKKKATKGNTILAGCKMPEKISIVMSERWTLVPLPHMRASFPHESTIVGERTERSEHNTETR